ncbi:MAG: hypothetical protein JRF33_26260, partial [Deltaproteobacteria bacterium]|nr:hypothetical protein [Deltaproteobacteria bacterium]
LEQLDSPLAKARLEAELARYQAFIDHSLPLIEAMSAGVLDSAQSADLRNFIATLEGPEPPIIGSTTLPYQNLAAAQRLPLEEPNLTPAYKGGNQTIQPADRQASPTAPLSQAIVNKARELNWNPVNIFDYVYNYVGTEWYHGSMKGAEQTLLQGSGNDCDQASLLVALLRASGYPARFVVGVGRLLDLDRAPLVFGVENTQQVLQLLRRAGIPHAQELSAGKLSNIRFERVWVEAYLPFTDYRGSAMEEGGELWTPMDTSLKAAGYELNEPPSLPEALDLTSISGNYLQADRPETPLEFLKAEIEVLLDATQADHTYEDLLQTREQKPQHQDILPSGLPFLTALVTSESTSLPERLLHKVKFTAYDAMDPGQVFFDLTLPAHQLSNRSIALRYEPETVEDQEIINSFGGLGATPAYLVRLRPVLTVAGQRLAIGTAGLPMGADARLIIELAGPAGTKRFVNELVVGNLTVMALVAGRPILAGPLALEQKGAERIYFDEALRYLLRWQAAEKELASLLRLKLLHPAPQVVTLGGVVQVNQVLGVPHEFTWKGAFVDADLRQVELVGDNAAKKLFMDLSGLQGSVLEDRVLREDLGVDSISTARLLAIANNQGIPLVTIDASNIDTLLPTLPFGTKVSQDIRDAVQQGQQVLVPDRMLTVGVWTGVGYMRSDPLTGEAGWMLSGLIAGAYTVVDRASWPGVLGIILETMMISPPNFDEYGAHSIAKLLSSDRQSATVGTDVELKVRVLDSKYKPVAGANVSFTVLAGGGSLAQANVISDASGTATAILTLGTMTSGNPTYLNQEGQPYTVQLGLNVVDAVLTDSGPHLRSPFTALGMPDTANAQLTNLSGARFAGNVLSYAGCVRMKLEDPHGNPISNGDIHITALDPVLTDPGQSELYDPTPALLIDSNDTCNDSFPNHQEALLCPSTAALGGHELVLKSAINGASYCAVLGGSPGADYPVLAQAVASQSSFDVNFFARFLPLQSDLGICNLIEKVGPHCVGQAGSTLQLPVWQQFVVRDRNPHGEQDEFCEDPIICPLLSLENTYTLVRAIPDREIAAWLASTPEDLAQVSYLENGRSLLGLTLPVEPGIYEYNWTSRASTPVRFMSASCDPSYCIDEDRPCTVRYMDSTYDSGQYPAHDNIECVSVGMDFYNDPYAVNLDDYGYTTSDNDIEFQILPTGYHPDLALLEVFFEDGAEEVPVFYSSAVPGDLHVTIGKGTYFDMEKNYYARLILDPGTSYEMRSTSVGLVFYSAKLNLSANRPGTIAEPGEVVSEYHEDDPEKLVMYVNSNRTPPVIGERDFNDDVIDPSDKDIVKLDLKRLDGNPIDGERISFSLEPAELFKIYNENGIRLYESDLANLATPIDPTLNINEQAVTLYIESLGPVYGAEAKLSIFDSDGDLVVSDSVLLTAVFHEEDFHKELSKYSKLASICTDPFGSEDEEECVRYRSIWRWTDGRTSAVINETESQFWENRTEVFYYYGTWYKQPFMRLRSGQRPDLGIKELFRGGSNYMFECNNAVRVIVHRVLLSLVEKCNQEDGYICILPAGCSKGEDAFNYAFQ